MKINELIGRTIKKVYAVFGMEQDWLDTADCFLELDSNQVIGFPFFYENEVWIRELPQNAEQLFQNNERKIVIGKCIVDFLWYSDADYGGYFLLDDGSLVTETRMSPQGTGLAGLNFYENLQELMNEKGMDIKKLSEQKLTDSDSYQ